MIRIGLSEGEEYASYVGLNKEAPPRTQQGNSRHNRHNLVHQRRERSSQGPPETVRALSRKHIVPRRALSVLEVFEEFKFSLADGRFRPPIPLRVIVEIPGVSIVLYVRDDGRLKRKRED